MKLPKIHPILLIALLGSSAMFGYSSGPPTGMSGAPGDLDCTSCHSGNGVNSGPGKLTIAFPDPNGYVAGQKYRLHVSLADPTARRWGFELTDRKEASTIFAGAFAVVPGSNTLLQRQGNFQYVTHNSPGTFAGTTVQAGWDVDWTAPTAGTGTVRFYAAGNAANNDGTSGNDKIYTTNLAVAEQQASTPPPAITAGNTVFSQFVFGGGWYSGIYFTNQTASPVTINLNFYTDKAAPMTVAGGTTKALVIPAGGTSIFEALNTGTSATSGWATCDLPQGVTGYGVFRQSVAGKGDQEAVVPLAASTGTKALLTFDETAFTTALAVWYNGSSSGAINLTAKDEAGNVLGTATLNLDPGTKSAFALSASIAAIANHRGSVTVSTSSGTIAVLGLRFGGSAFTSIPAAAVN